ncbi:MAG: pyruvate dehydrogenase (acetyl-transferring) E1 component subunit alpha [Alphaproteobacteria bacterium 33-17]|nr:MAG: pyruvate dehydrogenase (acetyl-transferring) E1 component subunit alpha [Alphaproteobacteria bacterium 33-17]
MSKQKKLSLAKDEYLKLYYDMLLIRRFEEKAGQLYGMGLIGGFCHLYIGQEAVVVGIQHNLIEGDQVITSYRDHGHMLACGMDPRRVMAELLGRIDGCSKGKGGSMHMFDIPKQFFGGHGIVGAQVPIGAGLAFANAYRDNGNISVSYFGDGAAHQGQVYEAFNMAALWKLPALFIVENNMYAMGTSVERATVVTDLYKKGESFGIPGYAVNGMDVLDVIEGTKKAIDHIRSGKGPYLLELKTYRYRGHSMSDPAKYRSKEEVNEFKENRDPIDNLRNYLLSAKKVKESDLEDIEKSVKALVAEVVEFAQNSPEPDPSELMTDIYNDE